MADILTFVLLLAGLVVLVKSSELTIEKSIRLSRLLEVKKLVIGFFLLAFATSLPELTISFISSLRGEGNFAAGVLFGANIADITLVFAAAAFTATFTISRKDYSMVRQAVLITSLIAVFSLLVGGANLAFGIFAVIMFFVFMKYLIDGGIRINEHAKPLSVTLAELRAAVLILAGIALVIISAHIVTDSSIAIARSFGISEALIGATIVAAGTTLPEVAVTIAAVRKKQTELAVGNIAGSLVTNAAFILGVAAVLSPISYTPETGFVVLFSVAANIALFYFARRRLFGLLQSLSLFSLYALFIIISAFHAIPLT